MSAKRLEQAAYGLHHAASIFLVEPWEPQRIAMMMCLLHRHCVGSKRAAD